MRLPLSGDRLLTLRQQGKAPKEMIVVSFVGFLRRELENLVLVATPGSKYDWRLVKELPVLAVLDDGKGSMEDLLPIAKEAKLGEFNVLHRGHKAGAWGYVQRRVVDAGGRLSLGAEYLSTVPWTRLMGIECATTISGFIEEAA